MSFNESLQDVVDDPLDFEGHGFVHPLEAFLDIWNVIAFVVKSVVCLGSTAASILLIYVTLKFKKLTIGCNIYLYHYAVSSLLNTLLFPISVIWHQFNNQSSFDLSCVIIKFESITSLALLSFATASSLDWFSTMTRNKAIEKYQRNYLIIAIYVFLTLAFVFFFCTCTFFSHYQFFDTAEICVYLVLMTTTAIVNFRIRRKQLTREQLKFRYVLTISTYLAVVWLLVILYDTVISELFDILGSHGLLQLMAIVGTFIQLLVLSGPMVVTYILGHKGKHFKMAFVAVLRCFVRTNQQDDFNDEAMGNSSSGVGEGGAENEDENSERQTV